MIKLHKKALLFSLFTLGAALLIVLALALMTYQALAQKFDMELITKAYRIDHSLSSMLEKLQSLMVDKGKHLAQLGVSDPQIIWEEIHNDLGQANNRHNEGWPLIGWANDKNILILDTYGVLGEPQDFSSRNYVHEARQIPGKIHFDPPYHYIPTDTWLLNAGLGVLDEKGVFIGLFTSLFNGDNLIKHIKIVVGNPSISFALHNEDNELILNSAENELPLSSRSYTKKMTGFPLTITTYVDEKTFKKEWFQDLTPHLWELFGFAIAYCIIWIAFWKSYQTKNMELDATKGELEYVFSLAKASDAAKEEFLQRIDVELGVPLKAMTYRVNLVLKSLSEHIDTALCQERQIELYEEILEQAQDFKNLTNNVLNLSEVDVLKVIKDCVTIQSKIIFEKNLKMKMIFPDSLPKLLCDEVKIKQICVGLISRAISFSPNSAEISIQAQLRIEGGRRFIQITLEDRGFGLPEEVCRRIEENFDLSQDGGGTHQNLSTLERLVHMHQGDLTLEGRQGKGTLTTLRFPLLSKYEAYKESPESKITHLPNI